MLLLTASQLLVYIEYIIDFIQNTGYLLGIKDKKNNDLYVNYNLIRGMLE
jgi:hypothetical protein